MSAGAFAFTKWYLDCLDRDGRLVIVYWASLVWRRVRLTWHSASVFAPGVRTLAKSSVVPVAPPLRSAECVTWNSQRIDCDARLDCGVPGIAPQTLADGVTWACVAPAARAMVRVGEITYEGTGYAEYIELRVPPWKLGIRGLRWGRWISNDATRSMVWIAWNDQKRWLFLDDRPTHVTSIEEDAVRTGTTTLELGTPTVLVNRGLGHTISKIPALRAVAPKWLLGGSELRRTRSGVLSDARIEVRGTAVDEVVEFG